MVNEGQRHDRWKIKARQAVMTNNQEVVELVEKRRTMIAEHNLSSARVSERLDSVITEANVHSSGAVYHVDAEGLRTVAGLASGPRECRPKGQMLYEAVLVGTKVELKEYGRVMGLSVSVPDLQKAYSATGVSNIEVLAGYTDVIPGDAWKTDGCSMSRQVGVYATKDYRYYPYRVQEAVGIETVNGIAMSTQHHLRLSPVWSEFNVALSSGLTDQYLQVIGQRVRQLACGFDMTPIIDLESVRTEVNCKYMLRARLAGENLYQSYVVCEPLKWRYDVRTMVIGDLVLILRHKQQVTSRYNSSVNRQVTARG